MGRAAALAFAREGAKVWASDLNAKTVGELEGKGRDEDALAFRRDAHEFRNALLAEQPNGDYAETTARQFLFDHWHLLMLRALERSSDARVAEIAAHRHAFGVADCRRKTFVRWNEREIPRRATA